jgi:hypothetical protein
MTKIQFRFKIIKILGKIKIDLYIPVKARLKISLWITNLISLFIKFENVMLKYDKLSRSH